MKAISIIMLLVCLFFMACDGDGEGGSRSNCVRLDKNPRFLDEFTDCPTDGLTRVCNSFKCEIPGEPLPMTVITPSLFIDPSSCNIMGCFDMECDLFDSDDDGNPVGVGSGIINIDEVFTEDLDKPFPGFFATGVINGEQNSGFECVPLNPNCIPQRVILNSDCPAEDLLNVCEPFFCGAQFETPQGPVAGDFSFPPQSTAFENVQCAAPDCHTLLCETRFEDQISEAIFTDLLQAPDGFGFLGTENGSVEFFCF